MTVLSPDRDLLLEGLDFYATTGVGSSASESASHREYLTWLGTAAALMLIWVETVAGLQPVQRYALRGWLGH